MKVSVEFVLNLTNGMAYDNCLKNKKRDGSSWIPSLPLILAAWDFSSDSSKKLRLIEHLNWAEKQNQLDAIFQYLNELKESDWYHKNE